MSARILQVELAEPLAPRPLGGYTRAYVLVRLRGVPLGAVPVECPDGTLAPAALQAAVRRDAALMRRLADAELRHRLAPADAGPARPAPAAPTWTVVVCTRERPDDLARCLASLAALDRPSGGEVVVVDNAPSTEAARAVAGRFPVRYVREDRPGLNWARTRGAAAATGEIVAFTDDDVVVEPGWLRALLAPFADPRVGAVTGPALPLELETEAQELFERFGGFGRGWSREVYDLYNIQPADAGRVGAGANMAIRRALIEELRLFEAELDCGTVARTGGDTYAFYRLLDEGYRIVYEPEALVHHRHRRDHAALVRTAYDYSVGGYAYLLRCFRLHGDWSALEAGWHWFLHDHLKKLARTLLRRPGALPLDLVLAYFRGVAAAPAAYRASRRRERELAPPPSAPPAPLAASGEVRA